MHTIKYLKSESQVGRPRSSSQASEQIKKLLPREKCCGRRNSSRSIGQSLEAPCERDELRFDVGGHAQN